LGQPFFDYQVLQIGVPTQILINGTYAFLFRNPQKRLVCTAFTFSVSRHRTTNPEKSGLSKKVSVKQIPVLSDFGGTHELA